MLARIALIVVCLFAAWKFVDFSDLSNPPTNKVTNESSPNKSPNNELGLYSVDNVDQVKKELTAYVADNPADYAGELSQVNTLLANKEYDEANKLLQSTREQYPDQPALLARHAETIALMNNGKFSGQPFNLLGRALDIDIKHKPSLWMMALVNQQMENHEAAIILLKLLKREMPSDSVSIETINSAMAMSLVEIENQIDGDPIDVKTEKVVKTEPKTIQGSSNNAPSLNLYVTLEPEILKQFSPEDTVFIYARATQGEAMPLAVARRKVSDFPATVTLDDSMAMMPAQNLSSTDLVTVGARASRSGTAMPLTGDWEVELYDVPVETKELIPINIHYELK